MMLHQFNQSWEAPTRSEYCRVIISMEILPSFIIRHFGRKTVVVSWTVSCLLRLLANNIRSAYTWDTSTRRSHSAQITSPRIVGKSCLIHRSLSPLLHEQIQIHRRYSILKKTCSCNRIKLNYQATKKKIESTRKHRRLGSKFCGWLHHNYVTCSKTKKIH